MNTDYGFENDKFYVDYISCSRIAGNMREESDRRARELHEKYKENLYLAFSGGIDSQSVLHSFMTQGLPIKTIFKYMPGYNDNELGQVKFLDSKYGIQTEIVDVDPIAIKEQLEEEEKDTGIHIYGLFWKHFISLLPPDINFVQMVHDPYVHINKITKNPHWMLSYFGPEISKDRAYNTIKGNRTGEFISFGDTPEFLFSILNDDVYRAAITSVDYYNYNGLSKPGTNLYSLDRWDYYIKPIIYGKYWKRELEYYPKFVGFTNLPFLGKPAGFWKTTVSPNLEEFLSFLGQTNGEVKRFYQTWTMVDDRLVSLDELPKM